MKAARWHGRRDVRVEDVPVPTPGRGEILLRVRLCGICGTDLEEYRRGPLVIPTGRPHPLTGRQARSRWATSSMVVVEALGPGVSGFREERPGGAGHLPLLQRVRVLPAASVRPLREVGDHRPPTPTAGSPSS